jgi:hypothetical protein
VLGTGEEVHLAAEEADFAAAHRPRLAGAAIEAAERNVVASAAGLHAAAGVAAVLMAAEAAAMAAEAATISPESTG